MKFTLFKNQSNKFLLPLTAAAIVFSFQNCGSSRTFSEYLLPSCQEMTATNIAPVLKWDWKAQFSSSPDRQYPTSDQVMAAPMVADLNGDNIPEVVFITFSVTNTDWYPDSTGSSYYRNGVLRIVDGSTGKNLKSIGTADLAPHGSASPLLIDIDRDGKVEIVYSHYVPGKVVVLNHDGSLRWKHTLSVVNANVPVGFNASDVDKDGIAEFLVGRVLLTETSQKQPKELFASAQMGQAAYPTFNVALDPRVPGTTYFVTYAGVFNSNGTQKFLFPYTTYYVSVGDLFPEIKGLEIVASGVSDLTIYNGLTGAIISHIDLAQYNSLKCPSGTIGGGPASIGDFDGDPTTLEIAIATGRYLTIFNRDSQPIYQSVTQDCSSLRTALTSFDLNGDKKPEILYADEEYLRIYEVENGQLKVRHSFVNPSGTLNEYPIVVDVDGNGSAEIVVASNNYAAAAFYKDPEELADADKGKATTGVRAFTSSEVNRWMPTRPIWNQFNYHPDQVDDDAKLIPNSIIDSTIFRRNNQGYNRTLECRPV